MAMSYTLGEAAKASGKSKPTIQRAIKSGKISAKKNSNGCYVIDPAELHRVYPPVTRNTGSTSNMKQSVISNEVEVLRVKLEATEQRLADRDNALMDLRRRLDVSEDERRQAQERLTALLEDKRERKPAARPKRGGLFSLFGGDE
jgi:hypothetical protein